MLTGQTQGTGTAGAVKLLESDYARLLPFYASNTRIDATPVPQVNWLACCQCCQGISRLSQPRRTTRCCTPQPNDCGFVNFPRLQRQNTTCQEEVVLVKLVIVLLRQYEATSWLTGRFLKAITQLLQAEQQLKQLLTSKQDWNLRRNSLLQMKLPFSAGSAGPRCDEAAAKEAAKARHMAHEAYEACG